MPRVGSACPPWGGGLERPLEALLWEPPPPHPLAGQPNQGAAYQGPQGILADHRQEHAHPAHQALRGQQAEHLHKQPHIEQLYISVDSVGHVYRLG